MDRDPIVEWIPPRLVLESGSSGCSAATSELGRIAAHHVRFGSKADVGACPRDVRFTPESGHGSVRRDVRFVQKQTLDPSDR